MIMEKDKLSTDYLYRDISICFTGHRNLPETLIADISSRLDWELNALYSSGFRRFFAGGALGFDTLAAQRVLALKACHDDVQLILVVPCATQSDHWASSDKQIYSKITGKADDVRILSEKYYTGCMDVRNRYMVNRSSVCVCYMTSCAKNSGTWSTVRYAMEEGIIVDNIAIKKDLHIASDSSHSRFIPASSED